MVAIESRKGGKIMSCSGACKEVRMQASSHAQSVTSGEGREGVSGGDRRSDLACNRLDVRETLLELAVPTRKGPL